MDLFMLRIGPKTIWPFSRNLRSKSRISSKKRLEPQMTIFIIFAFTLLIPIRAFQIKFHLTSGIYEVFLERSGRKIWVKPEPRAEPYIPCYTPRAKRSGARAQRGATERSEFKKYFSFNRILIGFFFNLNKFVFVLGEGQRGIKGVNALCPKLLIPSSGDNNIIDSRWICRCGYRFPPFPLR